ncbi:MAG: hypothetical protein N2327_04140 [Caldimicrobium sp.]|nr:hypothetical protein [Caldimicrobium sp.]MCX7873607.1 hypothetical protein [Caldimicrobium sp.]MDW8095069.1 hypothetical protein [Caldimicrobium sp.]
MKRYRDGKEGITAWGGDADGCNCVFLGGIRRYVLVVKDVASRYRYA